MLAEVISIGDELTSGQRLDTNSQWLSQCLSDRGIVVHAHQTIGDYLEPMQNAFRESFKRSELVIITGGLGPTQDDLTRQALAAAFNVPIEFDETSWQMIQAMFARRGLKIPESNRLQAYFPAGSSPIPNPHGTAPGIFWRVEQNEREVLFFCLPGVPSEMREMYFNSVVPQLQERLGQQPSVIVRQVIKTFGVGESQVENLLPNLIVRGNDPQVGITASDATISLRIQTVAPTVAAGYAKIKPVVETIQQCLGTLIYGHDDDELEDVVVRQLEQRQIRLAVVEWGTRGMVTQRLDEAYSRWQAATGVLGRGFQGAVVLTHAEAVRRWLEPDVHLRDEDIGNLPHVVQALTDIVAQRFQADLTLACGPLPTGSFVAQHTQDQSKHEPSSFLLSSRFQNGQGIQHHPQVFSVAGHPSLWRPRAAKQMLNHLRLLLDTVDAFDTDVR